ncbi:antibiotic biosynthesis monooxygenase [Pseudomonas sp. RHF3.3-3]|uniref:antibiotic biosynthesis monooxygenase n=1 Tax=Pseudomonas sp. RHF3.3-3 TaxID=3396624 RepID=UPI003A88672C
MPTQTAPHDIVTLVVRHRVRAQYLTEYEAWLKTSVRAAMSQDGHLGVNVIRPGEADNTFTTIVRFIDSARLQAWINSQLREQLIREVAPLLEEEDHPEIETQAEFWFTPNHADSKQPPKWKQALLSYGVIAPLSMVIPQLWGPVFQANPVLGGIVPSNLIITACIVGLVTYLIMPKVTRWLAPWLAAK